MAGELISGNWGLERLGDLSRKIYTAGELQSRGLPLTPELSSSPRSSIASQPFCSNSMSRALSAALCCPHRIHLTPKSRCSGFLYPATLRSGKSRQLPFQSWGPEHLPSPAPTLNSAPWGSPASTPPYPVPSGPGWLSGPCYSLPAVIASFLYLLCNLYTNPVPPPALCTSQIQPHDVHPARPIYHGKGPCISPSVAIPTSSFLKLWLLHPLLS